MQGLHIAWNLSNNQTKNNMKTIEEHLEELFVGKEIKVHTESTPNSSNTITGIVDRIEFTYDSYIVYFKRESNYFVEILFKSDTYFVEILSNQK